MTTAAWIFSVATLPLLGVWILSSPELRSVGRLVQFVAATCVGIVTLTLVMFAESLLGIHWTILGVVAPVALPSIIAAGRCRTAAASRPSGAIRYSAWILVCLVPVALLSVVTMSGGATAFDLLFFWGTKGEKFALAGGIDTSLLAIPANWVMHPDYPPLLPILYAWTALWTSGLQWFGAIALTPICCLLILLTLYGCAREFTSDAELQSILALGSALFSLLFVDLYIAGDAEPILLFFEAVVLGVGTWHASGTSRFDLILSLALAGVVLTKVEGVVFAAGFIGFFCLVRSNSVREFAGSIVRLGLLPGAALGAWIAFSARHGLLDAYAGTMSGELTTTHSITVIHAVWNAASYGYYFLPWLCLLAVMALGRFRARLVTPLAIAALHLPFLVYVYSHGQSDPSGWIVDSARRVLLTPLLCLLVAALAAHARPPIRGHS